jgi:hypothetical protein
VSLVSFIIIGACPIDDNTIGTIIAANTPSTATMATMISIATAIQKPTFTSYGQL